MPFNFLKKSFEKVGLALSKTRAFFGAKIKDFFQGKVDMERLEALEELLYQADFGAPLAEELTSKLKDALRSKSSITSDELFQTLKNELLLLFPREESDLLLPKNPYVILIVGVNGSGKTTSTAKLAKFYETQGYAPLLGALDTFRAAATEQLEIFADKLGIDIVKGREGSDPAAIGFDAVTAAISRGKEVVLLDTAGRLQTKTPLMHELEKVRRSVEKACPGSPHATYLVLDASVGQNAIDQAKTFTKFTPITGLILTKLDGSAKGGVIFSIQKELKIPVKFIGVGEGIEDLEPFNPETFVSSIFDEK